MTVVVGFEARGKVWIGADSGAFAGSTVVTDKRGKVFTVGPFLMAHAGSRRIADLLRYAFSPPERHPDHDQDEYMATSWVDSLHQCLSNGDVLHKENEVVTMGSTLLVGYGGKLYNVQSDFQLLIPTLPYVADGMGENFALGALAALYDTNKERFTKAPQAVMDTVLKAVGTHCIYVKEPFSWAVL